MRAVSAGLGAGGRGARRAGLARGAAWVTTCAWYTALCIALERFADDEARALESVDVTRMLPFFWHACDYVQMTPGCLVERGRTVPIHVWGADGGEERVTRGFGMGGHMGAKFFVNGDRFRRFRARVGLPSRHTEGQTDRTDVRFFVEVDEGMNRVFSEDIEYRARRVLERPLLPGQPAQAIDVEISGARTLILATQSRPYRDAHGRVAFDVPHVAVCEPVLLKA